MNGTRPIGLVKTNSSKPSGAGTAAILMILQIALIGYLLHELYYFATADNALSSLKPFHTGWQYFLPAAFAARFYLSADMLTRVITGITAIVGWLAWAIFAGATWIAIRESNVPESVSAEIAPYSTSETVTGLLWGSALGSITGKLLANRLNAEPSAQRTHFDNTAAFIVIIVAFCIGFAAGIFSWGGHIVPHMPWIKNAIAGGSVGAITGLSVIMGMRNLNYQICAGLFLAGFSFSALLLLPMHPPSHWYLMMGIASILALFQAGKQLIRTCVENSDALDFDIT